jgi:hypothetical protein
VPETGEASFRADSRSSHTSRDAGRKRRAKRRPDGIESGKPAELNVAESEQVFYALA